MVDDIGVLLPAVEAHHHRFLARELRTARQRRGSLLRVHETSGIKEFYKCKYDPKNEEFYECKYDPRNEEFWSFGGECEVKTSNYFMPKKTFKKKKKSLGGGGWFIKPVTSIMVLRRVRCVASDMGAMAGDACAIGVPRFVPGNERLLLAAHEQARAPGEVGR